jgi:hypothetical protein
MIPAAVMQVLVTMALLIGMTLEPVTPWEPDPAEATALAKTLYGECRGCSELQQRAVAWTIFNRVDSEQFPDTVIEVITQPSQFFGYKESFPVTEELEALACDCLTDWHNGEGRVFGPDFLYFFGNGRINIFSTEYGGKGERWAEE